MSTLATQTATPKILESTLDKALARIQENPDWPDLTIDDPKLASTLNRLLVCSEYAADILFRYPVLLSELIADGRMHRPLRAAELDPIFLAARPENETESQFLRRLRLFRHRELLRIIWRDTAGWSGCAETLNELSALADTCLRAAFERSSAELQHRHGVPRDESGDQVDFIVVAMGKLGGAELNFSSDVDLVFIYSDAGETDGQRALSNEEYFRRLTQHFIGLLSNKTADGFVYRVDARLRPFGDSGPLAVSVDAFENYLVQHGRNWERYAWVKARVINPWAGTHDFYADILRPFVYRRYLDFGVFASLREMKSMIEREGRAAENRENVKLGPGGIREIEFIVQTLQLVRGGTDRNLRQRSLMPALEQIGRDGLIDQPTMEGLAEAYYFLRDLENRLQMIADRQTHELPTDELDRARLVLAMNCLDWHELYAEISKRRDIVKSSFDEILRHERGIDSAVEGSPHPELAPIIDNGFADPDAVREKLASLQSGPNYTRMDEISRQRLDRLVPGLLAACAGAANQLQALGRTLRVIETICRRSAYIALLNENTVALERLVNICGRSDFLARQVASHPLLLDELLDQRIFSAAPSEADLKSDLHQRLAGVPPDDIEQRFEALRNFQQAAVFRVAVADLSGTMPLMKVSDRLTQIGELVLTAAIDMSWTELLERHGKPFCMLDGKAHEVGFAVAGYGKLGGLELGYNSDLDIVFMHDSSGEAQQTNGDRPLDNAMFFARLAQRVTHILTMPTPSGPLYEVDTRLRPSGNSGLLVTSLVALETYQQNQAWTWEHQAMLRARAVAGTPAVCEAFEELRVRTLLEYVRRDTLQGEVIKMRQRMRDELNKSTAEQFDIKHGCGGVIDIEFLVQYLVLLNAPQTPGLLQWSDNIRQLETLRQAHILDAGEEEKLADIYRLYRERMHLLSLGGEPRLVSDGDFQAERAFVIDLWSQYLTTS